MDKKKGRDNDIPLDVFTSLIQAPCDYCGTTEEARGLDRLDNSLGHLLSNVVPCCASCNSVRNDIFTPEQMRRFIGPAIAQARTLK
jgi:hypothetical protein